MWSVLRVCFFHYEASSTVLYATQALDRGSRQARQERIAVVSVECIVELIAMIMYVLRALMED